MVFPNLSLIRMVLQQPPAQDYHYWLTDTQTKLSSEKLKILNKFPDICFSLGLKCRTVGGQFSGRYSNSTGCRAALAAGRTDWLTGGRADRTRKRRKKRTNEELLKDGSIKSSPSRTTLPATALQSVQKGHFLHLSENMHGTNNKLANLLFWHRRIFGQ